MICFEKMMFDDKFYWKVIQLEVLGVFFAIQEVSFCFVFLFVCSRTWRKTNLLQWTPPSKEHPHTCHKLTMVQQTMVLWVTFHFYKGYKSSDVSNKMCYDFSLRIKFLTYFWPLFCHIKLPWNSKTSRYNKSITFNTCVLCVLQHMWGQKPGWPGRNPNRYTKFSKNRHSCKQLENTFWVCFFHFWYYQSDILDLEA